MAGRVLRSCVPCPPRSCLPMPSCGPIAPRTRSALEEDARLRNDIRLLGRILGDTVRDQEGADVFDQVERIRQTSIRFHRDDDRPARQELEVILDSMSTSQTVRIVRAFSYFSHLANIAEDQNNIRQMRARSNASGGAAVGNAGRDAGACARRRHQRRRPAEVLCRSAGQSGADRAPDGGSPQEHHRPRNGNRGAAGPARARPAHAARRSRPTTSSCAARCRRCGRPICCAVPSSLCSTRSPTACRSTITPSCMRCRGCIARWRTG